MFARTEYLHAYARTPTDSLTYARNGYARTASTSHTNSSSIASKDPLFTSKPGDGGFSDQAALAVRLSGRQGGSCRYHHQPESSSEIKDAVQEPNSDEDDDCRCQHQLQVSLFTHDIHELPDREWPVGRILESKVEKGERLYKVQWSEIKCLKIFIHKHPDGNFYVMIDGALWPVESYENSTCTTCCIPMVKVKWKATWKAGRYLPNAREHIIEFCKANGLPTPPTSDDDESIEVLTPASEPNHVPGLPQLNDGGETVPVAQISQTIPAERFQPQADVDYQGSDFREALSRLSNGPAALLKWWTPEMDQRSLTFRPQYIAQSHEFDLSRAEKARGVLSYFCGFEQQRQCECCEKETGFFTKCVVSTFSTKGACANCQSSGNARQCNFHVECGSRPICINAQLTLLQPKESAGRLPFTQCLRRHLLRLL